MHHFAYRNGVLHAEDASIEAIAAAVGTPFYCYSAATLRRHVRVFREAFGGLDALVAYSVKANANLAVLKLLANEGAGADVVSGGELRRARAAGVPAARIVFSGVGKTREEMALALDEGIHQFNVESEPELDALNDVAQSKGTKASIAFRVNPDVKAGGHEKISTGKAEDKFGVAWTRARDLYRRAASLPGIAVKGVDLHIGSQIADLAPFEAAFAKVAELVKSLRADGIAIERLDVGGGLGVPYGDAPADPPHPEEYARLIRRIAEPLGVQLICEPGRMIAGNAGVLVARVIYDKEGERRRFLILDAGMNDLIRPALYDAWHDIRPVREPAPDSARTVYDVVGPVCESSDVFARARALPPLRAGDLVAIMTAGAYGAVLSSQYNARPLAPEVLVSGGRFAVTRRRPSFEDMIALETTPDWLNG
ncbi:diaminopimelate decarboxylase [Amphiplicatus metriothermophilus]|uniref:Diaminopimelate decarboxylase n=1 Tax=Amphiplicatus metriothermophilus TaxID=1519374 RepID=A0A239PKU1_9PROT|nr:diaminopimelate decarboxylase [Amphiplicatus metriothermophilus]MBB5517233.1 diaminopimelate decarboxylase [Amphiplicatus metriothermophilus]SNT68431.1 diaminopimelate decarboxylase [Amphiplicatus metriothermophilus]